MLKRNATTGTAVTRNKRYNEILIPASEYEFSIDENDLQVVKEILFARMHTAEERQKELECNGSNYRV